MTDEVESIRNRLTEEINTSNNVLVNKITDLEN